VQKSDSIAALAAALAKAQGEFPPLTKGRTGKITSKRTGQSFSYSYADLADAVSTLSPILAKHGLSVMQPISMTDGGVSVETVLLHESGEWVSSVMVWYVAEMDNRAIGSAVTYARRYSYIASVGAAATDEDDDGEAASVPQARPPAKPASEPMRTREQAEAIEAALQVLGVPEAEWGAKVRKLAGRADSKTEAGAQAVLDALGRELDARTKAEMGARKPQEDHG